MPPSRTFEFTYHFETPPFTADQGAVDIFVPLPWVSKHQSVDRESITASIPGEISVEPAYGNRFWHARIEAPTGHPVSFTGRFQVTRSAIDCGLTGSNQAAGPVGEESVPFLVANLKVPVGRDVEFLAPIITEIEARAGSTDKLALARAIYDWVVENMEYKKVGNGWGQGDTFWACSERYGNCTDFHSLFISLARTFGIPARFEMGFPIPANKPEGNIDGYHCWLQFHLDGAGWIPVDASEAAKHPQHKEALFAAQPFDRIQFSVGRDLRLGEGHQDQPLNYFIYPYIEIAGKAFTEKPEMKFRYRG